jgi:hypothetical protein
VPFGQLLVFDGQTVCGLQTQASPSIKAAEAARTARGCMLFGDHNTPLSPDSKAAVDRDYPAGKLVTKNTPQPHLWTVVLPFQPRAMVMAGERLFVAGWPEAADANDPFAAVEGRKGGLMWVFAKNDGRKLAEITLDSPPVFDGLIAAYGRLYLATRDGKVMCLGNSGLGPEAQPHQFNVHLTYAMTRSSLAYTDRKPQFCILAGPSKHCSEQQMTKTSYWPLLLALFLAGLAMLGWSLRYPWYTVSENELWELSARLAGKPREDRFREWYTERAKLETPRKMLSDTGTGLIALAAVLGVLRLATGFPLRDSRTPRWRRLFIVVYLFLSLRAGLVARKAEKKEVPNQAFEATA